MKVKIANNAGFCFGVKRAMNMAWHELEERENGIYALGPLIHNKQAVSKYEDRGLKTVNELNDIPSNESVIIRSHGVGEDIYIQSKNKGINVIDTTCPFVKKIHSIAKEYSAKGYKIIVIGDKDHPEVIGINGWCNEDAIIIKTLDEIDQLNLDANEKYCLVSQTTINLDLYNSIVEKLSERLNDIVFKNTICSATKERQFSAKELSKEVDCMIVIGGKHSSNTQKLVNICRGIVPTFAVETKDELDINELKKFNIIGVTAGASTPDWIITEVINFIESI
ncbi:4-hydroxy-3-methylbut-2-enyl diphosphate reductase [Romboutsia ilealis]|uniref:4-hydroxy-3-methylbut-2-enyl diphosphate reductase n=1 Tax=Romboutsia faecis TaxID=2764597 RepID=A0ABR7JPL0_9FIRM|nr:4-hydroxy-3-methylbut-2-enyl diphosphate reductase [Romboutsia faecis]MBC5996698.1 4-hydroxy-3-methylbut-2-enyl diphosphate reductase [Romboutsia faecis]MRN24224.1 4-hydroxy-3-methylbut-2-enyl diphosphate reductase [Romboutsia ilealis]